MQHNFWDSKFESDPTFDNDTSCDTFSDMYCYNLMKLVINYIKLLPYKLLKKKHIFLLINVIQSVNVGTECSSDLPSIGTF